MNFKSKKFFQRSCQILKEFVYDFFHYSLVYAIDSLCWWLCYYYRPWGKTYSFFWRRKHSFIISYLKRNCPASWRCIEEKQYTETQVPVSEFHIWVFWWQGMENAPDLVKICYRQLCQNCGDKVVLLTRENLKKYLSFPDYIYEKVSSKKISLTHFSDIIRVSLLAQYGGLWIDATCWTSSAPPEWIYRQPFYSCKINDDSLWRGWLMGTGFSDHPVFVLIKMIFLEYWEKNDHLIHYLLLDHLLKYLFDNVPQIHKDMLDLRVNNSNRSELYNYLSQIWNPEIYERICADTWCFKLSWKTPFAKKTADGKKTFFGWMDKQAGGIKENEAN